MSKDVLFNEVVSKIVQTIFLGQEYTDNYGNIQRQDPPIQNTFSKIISELDFEELKARVQKELEDKYMDEVVKSIVDKLRFGIYEEVGYGYDKKNKFADFVANGLEASITKSLNNDEGFQKALSECINLEDVEIKVSIAKKERV